MAPVDSGWYLRCMRPWSPLLLVLLAACNGGGARQPEAPATPPAPTSEPAPPVPAGPRWQATGTVLEAPGRGPEFCLGAIMTSLPPQCRGLPLVGWDWDRVDGEERAQNTTWGVYHLVGSHDGKSFTPTQPPGPPQPISQEGFKFSTPCPTPAGGWKAADPKRATSDDLERINAAVQPQPDFAGMWLYDPNPPSGEHQDLTQVVLNVAFTGDVERHTAELRKLWGGSLCVVQHPHTEAALIKVQQEAQKTIEELGLNFLGSSVDVIAGVVEAEVVFADASHQARIDERHGAGVVVLRPRLRPAP